MNVKKLVIDGHEVGQFKLGVADTLWLRFRGLLGRTINEHFGIVIEPCNSIHTMWMSYDIDVVFVAENGDVSSIKHGLKPWRFANCRKSKFVIELSSGNAKKLKIKKGSKISWL